MGDSDGPKPGSGAGAGPLTRSATATPPTGKTPVQTARTGRKAGRVIHDERGNAVWDWLAETGRILVDSTSRLLRRLETPELKIEAEADQQLRLESDQDAGGGYDPYGRSSSAKPGGPAGGSGTKGHAGGGYDPYSRDVVRKSGRKV